MRIVLDENLPRPLLRIFGPVHQVVTVQDLGLAGTANGALLAQLEGGYDVFVTADKNLRYQQNLAGRSLAIVELPTNRLSILKAMTAEIASAVNIGVSRFLHPGRSATASIAIRRDVHSRPKLRRCTCTGPLATWHDGEKTRPAGTVEPAPAGLDEGRRSRRASDHLTNSISW